MHIRYAHRYRESHEHRASLISTLQHFQYINVTLVCLRISGHFSWLSTSLRTKQVLTRRSCIGVVKGTYLHESKHQKGILKIAAANNKSSLQGIYTTSNTLQFPPEPRSHNPHASGSLSSMTGSFSKSDARVMSSSRARHTVRAIVRAFQTLWWRS